MAQENFKSEQEVIDFIELLNKQWFSGDNAPLVYMNPSLYKDSMGNDWTLVINVILEELSNNKVCSEGIIESMRLFSTAEPHSIYLAVRAMEAAYIKGINRGKGIALGKLTDNLHALIFPENMR